MTGGHPPLVHVWPCAVRVVAGGGGDAAAGLGGELVRRCDGQERRRARTWCGGAAAGRFHVERGRGSAAPDPGSVLGRFQRCTTWRVTCSCAVRAPGRWPRSHLGICGVAASGCEGAARAGLEVSAPGATGDRGARIGKRGRVGPGGDAVSHRSHRCPRCRRASPLLLPLERPRWRTSRRPTGTPGALRPSVCDAVPRETEAGASARQPASLAPLVPRGRYRRGRGRDGGLSHERPDAERAFGTAPGWCSACRQHPPSRSRLARRGSGAEGLAGASADSRSVTVSGEWRRARGRDAAGRRCPSRPCST